MQLEPPKPTLAKPEPSSGTTSTQPSFEADSSINPEKTETALKSHIAPQKRSDFGWRVGSIVASIWLLAIVLIWLWLHAPFMPPLPSGLNASAVAAGLFNTIINLILLPLMALAATASGLRLLEWLLPSKVLNNGESLVVACGLGLGAIGFLVLGFGLLGLLGWPLAYGLLLGAPVLNYRQTAQILSQLQQMWQSGRKWWQKSNWFNRLLVIYIGLILGLTLSVSLLPPTAWDSLMYHLTAPQLYLKNSKVGPLTQIFPSNYPFGAEMLFTWVMALHNDTLAQTIHWLFGLLTVVSLILMANRFFYSWEIPRRQLAGLLAASFYLSIPLIQTLLTWAYTDLLVGFYGLLALYLLLVIIQQKGSQEWQRLAVLAGVMGGLCFGGKYWAVLALAGVGLAFLAIGAQEKLAARRLWGCFWLFGLATSLVACPWLIRNWFFSDNPFAPFLFGARGWDKSELNSFNTSNGQPFDLLNLLSLPWKLTISGQTGGQWDATISPLFLGLAPLIILAAVRDRVSSRAILLAVGVQFTAWAFVLTLNSTLSETRALTPAFPLLALVAAYGLVALADFEKARILRNCANLILGLYLVVNLFNQFVAFNFANSLPTLMGLQNQSVYLESELGSYWRVAHFISDNLPADTQIVSWLEPRSYYFNRQTRPDFHLDELFYYTSRYPTVDLLADGLKQRGATHLLISERGLTFMANTQEYNRVADVKAIQPILAELKAKYLTLLYEEAGEYAVYSLH